MTENQSRPPRRNPLEDIRKQRGLSEFLITAWGIIELNLNQVILREHNLSSQNPKAADLLRWNFSRKLEYQLKIGMISQEENETIQVFKEKRNRFFHDHGVFVTNLDEAEKQEIAEKAVKAVDVTYNLCDRVFDSGNNRRWIDAAKKA